MPFFIDFASIMWHIEWLYSIKMWLVLGYEGEQR